MQPHHRETGGQRMNAQDLKNSILQRAIEGKLVPQRKEEGTARELLAKIRAEKARLVKEKKIKKSKPLPAITNDEKPFAIPDSWEWVRIGELFLLQAGKNIKASEINPEKTEDQLYPCYGGNGIRGFVNYFNAEGDFPIIGRQGALCGNINRAKGKFYATEHAVLTTTFANTDVSWACYFLKALNLNQYATATAQPGLAVSKINQVLIPLPPIAEQHRIVAKIEELQPDIDAYDKAQTELAAIEERFPDDMKKSLLQYAIEGKLVPQRKEEGTAKDLLAEIRAEKAKLIKEKKIKKSKPLPAITDKEKPFAIPDSWEWVRLDDIVVKDIKRGKSPVYTVSSKILVFAQKCNTKDGQINLALAKFLDKEHFKKYAESEYMLPADIVINSTGTGTLGRVGFFTDKDRNDDDCIIVPDSHVTIIRVSTNIDAKYIFFALKSNQSKFERMGEGSTKQKELRPSSLSKFAIPLPPLAEQHRIVARLEELLPLCEQLAVAP